MKRLFKVTAMTGLLTLLKMAMGFVVAKVVAIYTGPTGMAMLGQMQSLVGSLSGIINSPVGSGVVRYTAEYSDKGLDACIPWWRASFQWVLIISSIFIPIGLLLSDSIAAWLFRDRGLAWVIIVTVCMLPFSAMGTLCTSIINGQQQYRRYVRLGMLSTLFSSSIMLLLIIFNKIQGALLAAAVQSALIGFVMLIANIRQPWMRVNYWWGKSEKRAKYQIANYMLMAFTSALTVPISLIFVRNILIAQVGWDAAGQWQAVWKISEAYLGVITIALGTYYLPRLSSLKLAGDIIKEINSTAMVVMPIVVLLAVFVFLFRDVIIFLLFTDDFGRARGLFAIQLIGDVIKIASWLYAYPMISKGATYLFVSSEIFFSILFVFLTYFFVSKYGVDGANIAYLTNYSLYFVFCLLILKRVTGSQ